MPRCLLSHDHYMIIMWFTWTNQNQANILQLSTCVNVKLIHVDRSISTKEPIAAQLAILPPLYPWYQVIVINNGGPCCCVSFQTCDVCRVLLIPFVDWFLADLSLFSIWAETHRACDMHGCPFHPCHGGGTNSVHGEMCHWKFNMWWWGTEEPQA